jgi:hypothetical protein
MIYSSIGSKKHYAYSYYWESNAISEDILSEYSVEHRKFNSTKEVHPHLKSVFATTCARFQKAIGDFLVNTPATAIDTSVYAATIAQSKIRSPH